MLCAIAIKRVQFQGGGIRGSTFEERKRGRERERGRRRGRETGKERGRRRGRERETEIGVLGVGEVKFGVLVGRHPYPRRMNWRTSWDDDQEDEDFR